MSVPSMKQLACDQEKAQSGEASFLKPRSRWSHSLVLLTCCCQGLKSPSDKRQLRKLRHGEVPVFIWGLQLI